MVSLRVLAFLLVVRGRPFSVPQTALEEAVLTASRGGHWEEHGVEAPINQDVGASIWHGVSQVSLGLVVRLRL